MEESEVRTPEEKAVESCEQSTGTISGESQISENGIGLGDEENTSVVGPEVDFKASNCMSVSNVTEASGSMTIGSDEILTSSPKANFTSANSVMQSKHKDGDDTRRSEVVSEAAVEVAEKGSFNLTSSRVKREEEEDTTVELDASVDSVPTSKRTFSDKSEGIIEESTETSEEAVSGELTKVIDGAEISMSPTALEEVPEDDKMDVEEVHSNSFEPVTSIPLSADGKNNDSVSIAVEETRYPQGNDDSKTVVEEASKPESSLDAVTNSSTETPSESRDETLLPSHTDSDHVVALAADRATADTSKNTPIPEPSEVSIETFESLKTTASVGTAEASLDDTGSTAADGLGYGALLAGSQSEFFQQEKVSAEAVDIHSKGTSNEEENLPKTNEPANAAESKDVSSQTASKNKETEANELIKSSETMDLAPADTVDWNERTESDEPINAAESVVVSSTETASNKVAEAGSTELQTPDSNIRVNTTLSSRAEIPKAAVFDSLLAEEPVSRMVSRNPTPPITTSHKNTDGPEIQAVEDDKSSPAILECGVVDISSTPSASTDAAMADVETITGALPSDADVCIVAEESSGGGTGRARPKRPAARAADNKIKALVFRTLEPMALQEVDAPMTQQCGQCKRTKLCRFAVGNCPLCSEGCHAQFLRQAAHAAMPERLCAQCRNCVSSTGTLSWETMDFCKEDCLAQYQATLGTNCINCRNVVPPLSMGKFCVRFGYEVKQFCSPSCLEEHKKGLKVCSYCQKDISNGVEGFLAPVGDKGQFKEFCTQACMSQYEVMSGTGTPAAGACAVCGDIKPVAVEVLQGDKLNPLCSEPCFAAFKFVNNVSEGRCDQCKKYFDVVHTGKVTVFLDDRPLTFCCKTCLNVYVLANRKIMPCGMCKVKKYNFDLIKKTGVDGGLMMCSLSCLKNFEGTNSNRRGPCDQCGLTCVAQFVKTPVIGNTALYFCSYKCAAADKTMPSQTMPSLSTPLSQTGNGPPPLEMVSAATMTPQIYQHIVTKPPQPIDVRNKAILCKPYMHNKGTSCRPMPCPKATQTDDSLNMRLLIPVPVPIYIPAPIHMYSLPFPVPIPFPLPVPVPIFIPTTRNSAKGIFKEIKKIQEKIPTDPFEAELLMMAEMVAGEKKQEVTDSESDGDGNDVHDTSEPAEAAETFSPEAVDTSNAFGEDMLQMALKMASELDEPAVDMESVLTSNTITPSAQPTVDTKAIYGGVAAVPEETAHAISMRGRKRAMRGRGGSQHSKRGRRSSGGSSDHSLPSMPNMNNMAHMPNPEMVQPRPIEVEKPDANLRLKYTFGVNAWRHWVMQKNLELEKAMVTNRKIKPFKPDLLQLTADELNFSLCLFVKEVKKPNGQEYAPDTIYYLCLGVQQYLFENGRIDNIFTDTYYEKFTDCLDEVAKRFAALYNDSQYIVTRVEEEHLWESKQLGAHSPHVLLSTLMFFNTKHFNLVTVEEHMQLSFSHIMKHWKRNPNAPGVAKVPGSRNVLLRFYPPQSALEANSRKKKVYEQQENEENPLRCPVKLYEFYLSKCPESVKTRNDVFYLLPERSCVPDSPVWYSTMALGKEPLMKMLHRVKMVKEINVALLTS